MDHSGVIPYFIAVAALTAAPGPIMAVLVARSVAGDARGACSFAAGLCTGDVIAVLVVALGIGVWVQEQPELLQLAKLGGVAYLLWIAHQMWTAQPHGGTANGPRQSGLASIGAGLALCLGNPSTLLIYMLLLPGVMPDGVGRAETLGMLTVVTLAAVALVFFGTILLARQLNRIFGSSSRSVLGGRFMAAVVGLTSIWILAA
jgi:threonine/homoserine/homoserine lactone efflux protein